MWNNKITTTTTVIQVNNQNAKKKKNFRKIKNKIDNKHTCTHAWTLKILSQWTLILLIKTKQKKRKIAGRIQKKPREWFESMNDTDGNYFFLLLREGGF